MNDFDYIAATTVDEAVSLMSAHGDRAKLLAGGTDILVQLREGLRDADLVVDLKKIGELAEMRFDRSKGLLLGAGVACHRIYGDSAVAGAYAGLADAVHIIGGWQIQSRATVGGNLCNASPAADSTPVLIALDARCQVAGPNGRRTIAAQDFCTAPGKNALERGEMLVAIEFPPPAAKSASAYLRFIPRNEMDIAVAGAGAAVELDSKGETIKQARIGVGAVAPTPRFAEEASNFLAGKKADDTSLAQAGELAKKIATPISDMRGTVEFRTHLVGVLVRRALAMAVERARAK